MIPTRKIDEKFSQLFSTHMIFSDHLVKREDNLLRDKYDHNSFVYTSQPSVAEFIKAIDYQKTREDGFIKLEGYLPLENSFGMEEEITLTMVLKNDANICSWKINPDIMLKNPDIKQLEQHYLRCYGPLYGESFIVRNLRRLYEKLTYHGAFIKNKLVGSCYTYACNPHQRQDCLYMYIRQPKKCIATTIIKQIVQNAYKKCNTVFLHADFDDTPRFMYEKMGFEEIDRCYEYTCTDISMLNLNL